MFAGCTVALVTPFKDGAVDEPALRRLVEWQIAQGTPILSPVGTTGEAPTLTHEEHERVIAVVVEAAAGRAKVMAGTGSNSTAEAIRLTRFAARAGADGALLVAPYYNRPNQEGIYRHFAAIAESVDIPLVLYNIPARTGRNVEPETIERLAAIGPIVAVKEAAGSLDQVSELVVQNRFDHPLRRRQLDAPHAGRRGRGCRFRDRQSRAPRCDGPARGIQEQPGRSGTRPARTLFPLCRDLLGLAPNPIPVKTALALLGRGNGELRLPLCPLDDKSNQLLINSLTRYGLLTDRT